VTLQREIIEPQELTEGHNAAATLLLSVQP